MNLLPAIDDPEREILWRISAMLCGASLALLVLSQGASNDARAETAEPISSLALPRAPEHLVFPSISVKRDPFATTAPLLAMPPHESQDVAIVLPPNPGASEMPPFGASSIVPVVRAVIVGEHPSALVETGGTVRVFSVGDTLGDAAITSIDRSGIALSNGMHLSLTQEPK
jgi:hypothetical protein